jgi:uncharacterized membrane-anchored protein
MDKKKAFILIAAFWLIILLSFVAYKQLTVSFGQTILLSAQPVDPRDPFRGDYIQLEYDASSLSHNNLQGFFPSMDEGDMAYVKLERSGKYWVPVSVGRQVPELSGDDACMRGTVSRSYLYSMEVDYGINSYFIPQGTGQNLRSSEFEVEVSTDGACNAVITQLYYRNGTEFEVS